MGILNWIAYTLSWRTFLWEFIKLRNWGGREVSRHKNKDFVLGILRLLGNNIERIK